MIFSARECRWSNMILHGRRTGLCFFIFIGDGETWFRFLRIWRSMFRLKFQHTEQDRAVSVQRQKSRLDQWSKDHPGVKEFLKIGSMRAVASPSLKLFF